MSGEKSVLRGRYRFEDGRFVPDDAMAAISDRLRTHRLLADSGSGVPSFLLDPEDGSYWQHTYFEDHSEELRRVDRAFLESNFPTVDPDRPIT